jgi:hypothetical protein
MAWAARPGGADPIVWWRGSRSGADAALAPIAPIAAIAERRERPASVGSAKLEARCPADLTTYPTYRPYQTYSELTTPW